MKEKWNQLEIFYKSIFFSIIYSLILILISLILLVDNISWIYGTIIGVGLSFFSYLIIWLLWYKIKKIKTLMAKGTPILVPIIRIILFLIMYLIILFSNNNLNEINIFLKPINTFSFLIAYSIPTLSYFSVWITELITKRKKGGEH